MNKKIHIHSITVLFMLGLFLPGSQSFAGKRYWVGNGSNKNWNSTGNWSTASGGTSGASVPGSSDTAYYNSSGSGQCSVNSTVSIKRMEIVSGYPDTVKQNANTITIGTGGAVLSGGVFWGGTANITDQGIFTLSGCNFKSTSAALSITGNYTFSSGTFTHNSGEVVFTATSTINGNTTFYDLTFTPTTNAAYTISSGITLTVSHLLKTAGSGTLAINTGTISAKGNITISNTSNSTSSGGTGNITVSDTSNQTITGASASGVGRLCSVTINKTGGALTLKDTINVAGNWTYTAGTINASAYTSTVCFTYNPNRLVTGKHSLYNLMFSSSSGTVTTINRLDTLTVAGSLAIEGANFNTIDSGVVNLKGNLTITNNSTSTSSGGTGTICFTGTATQTLTGTTTALAGKLCNIKISKTGGSVKLKNTISMGDNAGWEQSDSTRQDVASYASTVIFTRGNRIIKGNQGFDNLIFNSASISAVNTVYSGSFISVNGELRIEGTSGVQINTGSIRARGNVTITNTYTSLGAGSSTGTIIICGTGSQLFTGSGVVGAGKICNIKVDKASDTLSLNNIITGLGSWEYIKGTVSPGTSTLVTFSTYTLDGEGASSSMSFNHVTFGGNTTLNGNLSALGNVVINSGVTLNGNSKTVQVGGNWDNTGTFTYAGTTVNFTGSGRQWITRPSGSVNFHLLGVNKASGILMLGAPVTVNSGMTLSKGAVATTSTNLLSIPDNITVTGASDSSYVCGPVKKTGNDAFTFPLGDTVLTSGAYHPLAITAPSSAGDAFTAQYFATAHSNTTKVDSIDINTCEYWNIARTTGSSNVLTTVSWNRNKCVTPNNYDLVVAGLDGSTWKSLESTSIVISSVTGTVTAASTPFWSGTSAVPVMIAKKKSVVVTEYLRDPYCFAGSTHGFIHLGLAYGAPPFSYAWSNTATTQDIDSLTAGTYSLTVTDRHGRSSGKAYTLENCTLWSTLPSGLSSDTTGQLHKSSGDTTWATAQSTLIIDSLETGRWIKFTVADTVSKFLLGFGPVAADSTEDETNLMLFLEGRQLTVIETDNDGFYSKEVIGTVAIDDVLKVELNESQGILYYKNDVLVHTGKLLSDARLQLTANVYGSGKNIKRIRCSSNN
jgi:hypothetical protein